MAHVVYFPFGPGLRITFGHSVLSILCHQHVDFVASWQEKLEKDLPNKSQSCKPQKILFCTMNFRGMKAMTCLWSLFIIAFDWLERHIKRKVREHRPGRVWRVSHSPDAAQRSRTGLHPPVGSGWDVWGDCFLIWCLLMLLALNKYRRANRNAAMLQCSLEGGEKQSSSNGCFEANEIFLTRLITIKKNPYI